MFKKVIAKRLDCYLNKQEIPSKNKFGFKKRCSTYIALANVIESITQALDEKSISIGVFLDLATAFDTVDHSILLKLSIYGVRGVPINF